jgi:EAL domain-containing protein (putative c-di-GMP-specific phosphodiesterase class I)/CheY-like chemotaxis protein
VAVREGATRIVPTIEQPRQSPASGHFAVEPEHARARLVPSCVVVDSEPGVRRLIASVADDLGVRAEQFADIPAMLQAVAQRPPDLIFLDLGADGGRALGMLDAALITCPVQVMSWLNAVLVEELRRTGERRGLAMLPVLHKPLRHGVVKRIIGELGLRRDPMSGIDLKLGEALRRGWLEIWYQPKIDLRAKLLAGAEAYVRIRHPVHGIVPPDNFLFGAGANELLGLTEHVIATTLRDWPAFARFGVPLKLSVNVPGAVLGRLSVAAILRQERPKDAGWPGMILEVSEDDIVADMPLALDLAQQLQPYKVGLSVDDFGAGYASFARLGALPFCELKIDRSHVGHCDGDQTNAGLCETIIELAHRFGIAAVAEGIETTGELKALHRMNCDLGQGYLFARPLPKSEFAALLHQRGRGRA